MTIQPYRPPTLADALSAFLLGRSPNTLDAYRRDLGALAASLGVNTPESLAEAVLGHGQGHANGLALAWRARMFEEGLAPATINRRLSSLRAFVTFARQCGIVMFGIDVEPVRGGIRADTKGPGRDAAVNMLQWASKQLGKRGKRNHAMLATLYGLALRRSEVAGLMLDALDLPARRLTVRRKGGKVTRLTIPTATAEALASWLAIRGVHPGPLWGRAVTTSTVYRVVKRALAAVGVTGRAARPHGLRHTAITQAVEASGPMGLSLDEVRQFSGHSDVRTLLLYRDETRDVQGKLAEKVMERRETA